MITVYNKKTLYAAMRVERVKRNYFSATGNIKLFSWWHVLPRK